MSTIQIEAHEIEVSNRDKVLFPEAGTTKGELVDYYRRIAPVMVPHLEGRPLTMHRFPDGIGEQGFFQKQIPDYFPDWISSTEVEKEGGTVRHVLCNDAATLVYLAGQACITPHVWLSRADRPRRPDRMVFDLDPSEDDVGAVRAAARALRGLLDEVGLECVLMTTGSRGFHVVVPLRREHDFDAVRDLARHLAEVLVSREPRRLTVEQRKAKRGRRVFVDTLRNAYAQTTVAPYAVRARPGAPVATPIDWNELGDVEPTSFTIGNLFRRLGQKDDPWRELGAGRVPRQRLEAARSAVESLLAEERGR